MKEDKRKCFKCGASPAADPDTTLYRFPKPGPTNSLRCELWAKYCFTDNRWANTDFQLKLHNEHRMLCHRHFKETAFVDLPSKKLRRFASPDMEDNIKIQCLQVDGNREPVAGPSQPVSEVTNKNHPSTINAPGPSRIISKQVEEENFLKCKKYLHKICLLKR